MTDAPGGEPAADPGAPAVRAVALLGDEVRHRLYEFVRAARGPVTREQAATATGISRKLAAFHPLAARAPELVCGMNHAFLAGFLDGLEAFTVRAVLAPKAGECCVELRDAWRHDQA